jgi:hypothetical protein
MKLARHFKRCARLGEMKNEDIWKELNMYSVNERVGTALGYGLDNRGSRVRFPPEAGNFSLHHRVQNGSGAHPASYPMVIRCSFPGGKAAGAWSWPLTSISCRGQRMSGAIPPLPQYTVTAWCSVKAQGQLHLYLYKFIIIIVIVATVLPTAVALWYTSVALPVCYKLLPPSYIIFWQSPSPQKKYIAYFSWY